MATGWEPPEPSPGPRSRQALEPSQPTCTVSTGGSGGSSGPQDSLGIPSGSPQRFPQGVPQAWARTSWTNSSLSSIELPLVAPWLMSDCAWVVEIFLSVTCEGEGGGEWGRVHGEGIVPGWSRSSDQSPSSMPRRAHPRPSHCCRRHRTLRSDHTAVEHQHVNREMWARCGRDVGEMWARCGRAAGEMWAGTHSQRSVRASHL